MKRSCIKTIILFFVCTIYSSLAKGFDCSNGLTKYSKTYSELDTKVEQCVDGGGLRQGLQVVTNVKNSNLKSVYFYIDDKPHGTCSLFDEDGILETLVTYKHGVVIESLLSVHMLEKIIENVNYKAKIDNKKWKASLAENRVIRFDVFHDAISSNQSNEIHSSLNKRLLQAGSCELLKPGVFEAAKIVYASPDDDIQVEYLFEKDTCR